MIGIKLCSGVPICATCPSGLPKCAQLHTTADVSRLPQSMRQVRHSIQVSCCGGTNYCKDYLNRDQIHATYFCISSLISSFDLGLSSRLPNFFFFFSVFYYCTNIFWNILLPSAKLSLNQKAAFRGLCFVSSMRLSEDLMAQKVLSVFAHSRNCRSFAPFVSSLRAGHYTHQKNPPTDVTAIAPGLVAH